jgi:hypothetical protein
MLRASKIDHIPPLAATWESARIVVVDDGLDVGVRRLIGLAPPEFI